MQFRMIVWGILLLIIVSLSGCGSAPPRVDPPNPRPLGDEIKLFRATSNDTNSTTGFVEPRGELTLGEALRLTMQHNPDLAASAWEVRARQREAQQARRHPNPEVGVELENFGGSQEFSGWNGSETTIGISQLLQLGGKRDKRFELSSIGAGLASWDYETRRIEAFTETSKAFIDVLAAQQRLRVNEEQVEVAKQILDSVAQRVRAGAVSPIEEIRAQVQWETSRTELQTMRHELNAARALLASHWGSSAPEFSHARGDLERLVPLPPLEHLVARLGKNPDVARWETEIAARTALVSLEAARGVPDLTLGAGVRYLNDPGATTIVAGLAMPIPIFDRNQDARTAAEQRVRAAREQQRATTIAVHTELSVSYEALAASHQRVTALESIILPRAQEASDTSQDAYRRGLFRLTDVLDTQRTFFELRAQYFEGLAIYHKAKAEVERLLAERIEAIPQEGNQE